MTLRWLEGGEGFGSTTGDAGAATVATHMARKYSDGSFIGGADVRLYDGWGSGFGISLGRDASAVNNFFRVIVPANPTYFVGFAFKPRRAPTSGPFLRWRNNGDAIVHVGLQCRDCTGLRFVQGNGTILGEAYGVIFPDRWAYVEAKVVVSNTVGEVVLRVNGVEVINQTGLDTRDGGTSDNVDRIEFRGIAGNVGDNSAANFMFDDIYVLDNLGSNNNTFLGPIKIESLFPDAEGDQIDWTPSTGTDNSALVDENPSNSDTDYNTSSTVTHKDLLTVSNLGVIDSNIVGVQVNTDSRTDTTALNLRNKVKEGTTEGNGATNSISNTAYAVQADVFETNPNTGALWAVSEVNAMQAGYEIP